MKKTISITLTVLSLLVITLFGLFNITASAQTYGYYTYTVSNGEATITDCSQHISGNVVLPDSLGGYPITNISSYAFYNCDKITSITIPESVISIGKDAFYYCDNIKSVNIFNIAAWCNITFENTYSNPLYIAKNLYINGVLVTDIIIPDSVTHISAYAFYNCESIESITLPNTITSIGAGAFSHDINYTSSIKKVNINDLASWCNIDFAYNSSNPIYFSKNLYINGVLATDIIIPDSVTSINDYAFINCKSLESVIIPNSVKNIGFNAFGACDNIENMTLPFVGESQTGTSNTHFGYIFGKSSEVYNDVVPASLRSVIITNTTSINAKAFSGCANITNISLPESIVSIGEGAFSGCTSLIDITIDDENKNFVSLDGVLFNKQKTELICYPLGKGKIETSYDIPSGVTNLAPYTFNYCTNLINITIPDSVKTIGEYAFSNCTNLVDIIIPDNVISIGDRAFWCCYGLENIRLGTSIETIGEYAFAYCRNLSSIKVTDNVTSIGEYAFYDCENLKNVTLSNGMKSISAMTFSGCNSLESITIPNSVTSIKSYAFSSCTSLKSVIVPDSVTSIGRSAFAYCNKLESITLPFVGSSLDGTTDNHFGYIFGASSYSQNDTEVPESLKNVVITNATNIKKNAFRYCMNLESITIPKSVINIGVDVFSGCNKLLNVIVDVQNENFSSVDGVLFNKQKTELIYYPLGKGKINTLYTVPDSVISIRDKAFYNCIGLMNIEIPQGIKNIGNYAFYGCENITNIKTSDSLVNIGEYAFYGCTKLENITTLGKITNINNYAFYDCKNLKNIIIPNTVTNIGECAFYGCENLTEIIIPDSVKNMGNYAFYGCRNLVKVKISNNVPTINKGVFGDCVSLKNFQLSDGVINIGESSFFGCKSLTTLTISENVKSIDWGAFANCDGIVTVVLPDSIESISNSAFELCSNIKEVYYSGTKDKKSNIFIGSFNDSLINATWHYNSCISSATHTYDYACDTICDLCGAERTVEHNFEWIIDTDATCGKEGKKHEECTICHVKRNKDTVIEATDDHSYDNACDKTCNVCGKTRTVGAHKYSNSCDTSCNVCKANRKTNHSYKTVITKATLSKNGKKEYKCKTCGYVSSNKTTIYRPYSFKLSTTSYTYNGKVKKPTVTIKDYAGKTISSSNYTVTYASGRKNVGTYKVTIKMKGNYTGAKTLTFKINPISISKCKLNLSATNCTYNGKIKTPTVTVKNANGTKLTKNTHYTVTYASGRKNVGTYKVTIKMKGNYTGTKTLTFKINPKAASVNTLTAGSKKLTVKLNRSLQQSTGYQIQYSTSKTFKNAKTKTITSYKTSSTNLTGLKGKTTYYVRVRTYKTVGKTKYYSNWSSYKYKKTK